MKKILLPLFLLLFFNYSYSQNDKLITNSRIGPYKLDKQLNKTYDENKLSIGYYNDGSGNDKRITSIFVKSSDYKTINGFGVGSSMEDIKALDKKLIAKTIQFKKGNVNIFKIEGTAIKYGNIIFGDRNEDGVIDYVWIRRDYLLNPLKTL